MVEKSAILLSLQRRLPKFIEKHVDLIEYARQRYKADPSHWNFLVSQLWDLGQLHLANDEIEEARKCFAEGADMTLLNNKIREDISPGMGADYDTPLKAYLGDLEIGKLYSGIPNDITLKDLDDYVRAYKSWYYGLYGLIISNDSFVRKIINLIEEKTKDFKLGPNGMPPSITHKRSAFSYAIYYMNMLRAVIENDSKTFSENLYLQSRLRIQLFSRADNPLALVHLGSIVLYDVALGRGLNPRVDTPFIPEKILKNGYWYEPKWKE